MKIAPVTGFFSLTNKVIVSMKTSDAPIKIIENKGIFLSVLGIDMNL